MVASTLMSFAPGREKPSRPGALRRAAGIGAAAGLAGAGAMLVSEKVEQALTHRQNSYIPGRALLTLLGRHPDDRSRPVLANQVMHFATGAAVGALRGLWAVTGVRGLYADLWHASVRLAFDQTVENSTGVGAPPADWPAQEKIVDVTHKVVYSLVTGMVLDRAVRPALRSARGRISH